MKRLFAMFMALALTALVPLSAQASGGHDLNGAELSILWVVPFVCMLLSIAIGPLAVPHFWHHHFGKVALFWGLAFLVPCAMVFGLQLAVYQFVHVLFMEYVPFIILLFALFTIAGGVRLKGQLVGTPVVNAGLLALGTILASWMGTTGAAMLLIRPLLRANEHRKYRMHIVIFFIFLVANIGGSLTPLGDPPLFLGFLKGVSFFWTTVHLFCKTVLLSVILLGIFFLLDTFLFSKEGKPKPATQSNEKLGLDGKVNLLLLIGVVISVLMSGIWKPESGFEIYGTHIELQNAARDVILLALAGASLALTTKECRKLNNFTWEPILEVAKLFIGIFITMKPALMLLQAHGAELGITTPFQMFWATGALSSFLDNTPTYLVFLTTACAQGFTSGVNTTLGVVPVQMLEAISCGAVFMGASTYIGNAPNFMVKSISDENGIRMPSFFGYMLWSLGFLVPVFLLDSLIFFL